MATRGLALRARQPWVDLDIYLQSLREFQATGHLYCASACTELGFTYPPVAGLLLLPLANLPDVVVRTGWTVATIATALATGWWVLGRVGVPVNSRRFLLAALLFSEPVWMTVGQGQLSVFVGAVALLGYASLRPRWGGVALAGAAALKITPALAGVVLLAERGPSRWWRLGSAAAAGLTFLALGLLLGVDNTAVYFGEVLWDTHRVGALDSWSNSSVMGLLAHWVLPGQVVQAGGLVAGVLVVGALVMAARGMPSHDPSARAWLALAIALGSYLVTPIAWTHHCFAAPLAAAALWAAGWRVLGGVSMLVWALPMMGIAIEHADHLGTAMVQSLRPLTLMALFVAALVQARHQPGGRVTPGVDSVQSRS